MTSQAHEFLYIDGEKRTMMSCPDFPVGSLGITEESEPGDGVWNTTACWRKYVGTWVLEDGDLYLKKIEGRYRLNEPGLLFAHWFSGTLIVPDGELLEYVHMGFGSQYEREIHITISEGSVTDTSIIDNRAKRAEILCSWSSLLEAGLTHFQHGRVKVPAALEDAPSDPGQLSGQDVETGSTAVAAFADGVVKGFAIFGAGQSHGRHVEDLAQAGVAALGQAPPTDPGAGFVGARIQAGTGDPGVRAGQGPSCDVMGDEGRYRRPNPRNGHDPPIQVALFATAAQLLNLLVEQGNGLFQTIEDAPKDGRLRRPRA